MESRLARQVDKRADGCWIWTGTLTKKGYGVTYDERRRKRGSAHRIVKEHFSGRKLAGYQHLDHLCRNRACVNPDHLELVTQSTNTKRMLAWRGLTAENEKLREYVSLLEARVRELESR